MLLVKQGLAVSALNIKQPLCNMCALNRKSAAKKQAIGY